MTPPDRLWILRALSLFFFWEPRISVEGSEYKKRIASARCQAPTQTQTNYKLERRDARKHDSAL